MTSAHRDLRQVHHAGGSSSARTASSTAPRTAAPRHAAAASETPVFTATSQLHQPTINCVYSSGGGGAATRHAEHAQTPAAIRTYEYEHRTEPYSVPYSVDGGGGRAADPRTTHSHLVHQSADTWRQHGAYQDVTSGATETVLATEV